MFFIFIVILNNNLGVLLGVGAVGSLIKSMQLHFRQKKQILPVKGRRL